MTSSPQEPMALSEAELMATCTLMLFGGHETTANFIANGVLALLRHPEQLAAMREDRVDMKLALEEFMRYDGPGKTVVRVASEDFEFEGQQIRKGQRVFLMLSVANRDPLAFEDAELLKLDRPWEARSAMDRAVRAGREALDAGQVGEDFMQLLQRAAAHARDAVKRAAGGA